jgi:hypothetical protein
MSIPHILKASMSSVVMMMVLRARLHALLAVQPLNLFIAHTYCVLTDCPVTATARAHMCDIILKFG